MGPALSKSSPACTGSIQPTTSGAHHFNGPPLQGPTTSGDPLLRGPTTLGAHHFMEATTQAAHLLCQIKKGPNSSENCICPEIQGGLNLSVRGPHFAWSVDPALSKSGPAMACMYWFYTAEQNSLVEINYCSKGPSFSLLPVCGPSIHEN